MSQYGRGEGQGRPQHHRHRISGRSQRDAAVVRLKKRGWWHGRCLGDASEGAYNGRAHRRSRSPDVQGAHQKLADSLHLGTTVIFSTHDVDLSLFLGRRGPCPKGSVMCTRVARKDSMTIAKFIFRALSITMYTTSTSTSPELASAVGGTVSQNPASACGPGSAVRGARHGPHPSRGRSRSDQDVSSLMSRARMSATGVYGTKARKSAEASKLPIDYFFGADEGCIIDLYPACIVVLACRQRNYFCKGRYDKEAQKC